MRASFGIAIGISAIDALLSAFTAITVLALVIVSPTIAPGGSISQKITVIEIKKSAPGAGTSGKLLIDIQNPSFPDEIVTLASASNRVVRFTDAQHLFVSDQGRIEWSDPTCGHGNCSSLLTITDPKPEWNIRFRAAGDASPEIGADVVRLAVRKLDASIDKVCERDLRIESPVVIEIIFTATGDVKCPSP